MPELLPQLDTVALRQRLAGLIDPTAEKQQWFAHDAKAVAVEFCAALPWVFGAELDRMTMWGKIAAAIQSAHAKTATGDVDLFTQHLCESIKVDPVYALANERFIGAINALHSIADDRRQDFLTYLATHLIPVLVLARKAYQDAKGGAE